MRGATALPWESLVEGDQVKFQGTLYKLSDGQVLDLSGYTVQFRYRFNDGAWTTVSASIDSATTGKVSYQFPSGGLPGSGMMEYEWITNDGTNRVTSTQRFSIRVRSQR